MMKECKHIMLRTDCVLVTMGLYLALSCLAVAEETMFLPKAPIATDPSKIKGADLDKLKRLEQGTVELIKVAAGEDVTAGIQKAVTLLKEGKAVRVRIGAGKHAMNGAASVNINSAQCREPLFVLEGEGADKTVLDFSGAPEKSRRWLGLNNKHNVVIRNLRLENHPSSPISIGAYAPIQDNADFLIENCSIEKCYMGLVVFHVDGMTIRNVEAKNNARTGLFLIAKNAVVEDCVFTGNAGEGPGSFRGGIALAAKDTRISRVKCDDNPGRAAGLRMDHSCENIIVEDSTFNRNGGAGTVWETALGPCLIRNSEMNENGGSGIALSTAYNFTLVGCAIQNNKRSQIHLSCKPRPVKDIPRGNKSGAYGAANLEAGIGNHWTNLKGMMGNRFFTVKDCTFATPSPESPFYAHQYGKPDIYTTLFTQQFTASGNTYSCPGTDKAFDTFQGAYYSYNLVSFSTWKNWTGQEADSNWK